LNNRVVLFSVDGDTLVNEESFKKVYKLYKDEDGIDTISNLHCLLRQENDQQKIFVIRTYLGEEDERLAYNFDVNYGDTIVLTAFDFNETGDTLFRVDHLTAYDSVQIYNGEYRQLYTLYSINTGFFLWVVEGVGASNSPFPNYINGYDADFNLMTCLEVDDEYIFLNFLEMYYDPFYSCGLDIIDGIDEFAKTYIRSYPNPTKAQFTLELSNNYLGSDIIISINNQEGSMLKEYSYNNLQTLKLDIETVNLSNGLYFITLRRSKSLEFIEKLIIYK
jgi:hypothetical protein